MHIPFSTITAGSRLNKQWDAINSSKPSYQFRGTGPGLHTGANPSPNESMQEAREATIQPGTYRTLDTFSLRGQHVFKIHAKEVDSKKWTPLPSKIHGAAGVRWNECHDGSIRRNSGSRPCGWFLEQQVTIPKDARRLSMSGKTLKNWVGQARRGQLATVGESRRPVTELEAELSRLKRDLADARMEPNILKQFHRIRCQDAAARYALMRTLRLQYPLSLLCRVLEVSRSDS